MNKINIKKIIAEAKNLPLEEKINFINDVKLELHKISPFKNEPVDMVQWVKAETVVANDYNPNTVAPPEMKLLAISIEEDGYTQPIVAWKHGKEIEVVDGFHRNRVGKENAGIKERVHGYLPVAIINNKTSEKGSRIASTIRHNRARGKHKVESMSDIVIELKKRNWSNEKISRSLGMEEDEILRLCQISGLSELFADQEFSKSWNIEDSEADFIPLEDKLEENEKEENGFRTVNTSDPNRIFHTYEKWECYKAGFYESSKEGMTKEQCEQAYANFLRDTEAFKETLRKVITEWKYSCEHYLTNSAMNRIAWLGQASMCYAKGIPAAFCGGFNILSESEQRTANLAALEYLNIWLKNNNRQPVTVEEAMPDREATIY